MVSPFPNVRLWRDTPLYSAAGGNTPPPAAVTLVPLTDVPWICSLKPRLSVPSGLTTLICPPPVTLPSTVCPPVHAPAWHVSLMVHSLPSVHAVPLGA